MYSSSCRVRRGSARVDSCSSPIKRAQRASPPVPPETRPLQPLPLRQTAGAALIPRHGQLSLAEQHAAIQPNRQGQRKIVLATSLAETSLTIEGISTVVDCGYTRTMVFDPPSGLSRLKTIRISRDAADQRAGRAGRLGPGTCYRLWSTATEQRMAPYRTPEILEADLTSLLLDTAQWGVQELNQLNWLSPPPPATITRAHDLLVRL